MSHNNPLTNLFHDLEAKAWTINYQENHPQSPSGPVHKTGGGASVGGKYNPSLKHFDSGRVVNGKFQQSFESSVFDALLWPKELLDTLTLGAYKHAAILAALSIGPAYYLYGSPLGKPLETIAKGYLVASVGAFVANKI